MLDKDMLRKMQKYGINLPQNMQEKKMGEGPVCMPVDMYGEPVEKTKMEYPYSYDAHVIWRGGLNEDIDNSCYSDRLLQWGREKYNELCEKHFGNQGQWWNKRNPKQIESFLRDYFDNPKLNLILILEGANQSSGYPYWVFMYNTNKEE